MLRRGRAAHTRQLSVHLLPGDGHVRTTVVAGRAVGNAVARNRAKRRVRAALRELSLPSSADVVVVARPQLAGLTHDELVDALAVQVRRAARPVVPR